MNAKFLRRQHKWFGLIVSFFLLMFCISGIILNHRDLYNRVNVSRLPHYRYENWNSGLLRGTLALDSANTVIFGNGGLWLYNGKKVSDYNTGLPDYADFRIIRNVVQMPDSSLFAAGQYELYRRTPGSDTWQKVRVAQTDAANEKVGFQERYSDIAAKGDTLLLLSRDRLLLSLPPYTEFVEKDIAPPADYTGKVQLFKIFWLIHNGSMFGLPGKVIMDIIGLVIIVICLTGIMHWLFPKILRRTGRGKEFLKKSIKTNRKLHVKIGAATFFVALLLAFTGWCLRPPLLIPLVKTKVGAIPGTPVAKERVWNDKLRAIRYDPQCRDWLLVTSEGFYSLTEDLSPEPVKITDAPHVSVMGVNVLEQDENGDWLVGSLSGMWRWNRENGTSTDYFTGEAMPEKAGPPFGKKPVAGYSKDFGEPIVADYYEGTPAIEQPDALRRLPMSLWQLALEVHTGRIYHLFGLAPLIWIFLAGAAILWTLYSGWKLRTTGRKK